MYRRGDHAAVGGCWGKHFRFWQGDITILTDIYRQQLANSWSCRGCCFTHSHLPTLTAFTRQQTDRARYVLATHSCLLVDMSLVKQRPMVVVMRAQFTPTDIMISPWGVVQGNNFALACSDLLWIDAVISSTNKISTHNRDPSILG